MPVNFNHIKLSRPLTEGTPALYYTPPHSAAASPVICGSFYESRGELEIL